MQTRDIHDEIFEIIATELDRLERCGDTIEIARGRHEDHGEVIMVRDATRSMALVDETAFIDMMVAERSPGIALLRALRAGH